MSGLPNVIINIDTTSVASVVSDNFGITGLVLTGVAVTDKLETNKAYYIHSLDDAKALGILETGDNAKAYRHIKEFYDEAVIGTKLWIIVGAASIKLADRVDKAEDVCLAKILIDAAAGEIKVLGVTWTPTLPYVPVQSTGIDQEVIAAITNAKTLAADYLAKVMPFAVLVEGLHYSGDSGALLDLRTKTSERVGVILAGTEDDNSASVGLALGRLSKIEVQRNAGRVKDGGLAITAAYLSDGKTVEESADDLGDIHDKGYMIIRKFPRKADYFFNDDPTCVATSNDLCQLSRVRTIDKAVIIAYDTYVEEINDDVDVNADGTMDAAIVKSLQQKIEKNIKLNMSDNISSVSVFIDPTQPFIPTKNLNVDLSLVGKGTLGTISVTIGFSS